MTTTTTRVVRALTAASLGAVALVAVSTPGAEAAGVPCQRTYSSATDVPIPDNLGGGAESLIDIPEDGLVVSDVDVTVNIDHNAVDELVFYVASVTDDLPFPVSRGSAFLFVRDTRTLADDFTGTVFDDEASIPITWGTAPFTGRFLPAKPLSQLDGSAGGKYALIATDYVAGETGTILDWSITFRYVSCDFDGDGVEDHRDSCLQIAAASTSGCPLATRAVTATYKLGKFKGALSSPVASCKAGREVTIWKQRSGADWKVGTATSASDGRYKLTRAKRAGKYYATSPRVAVTDVAECPAVQSATFRIR